MIREIKDNPGERNCVLITTCVCNPNVNLDWIGSVELSGTLARLWCLVWFLHCLTTLTVIVQIINFLWNCNKNQPHLIDSMSIQFTYTGLFFFPFRLIFRWNWIDRRVITTGGHVDEGLKAVLQRRSGLSKWIVLRCTEQSFSYRLVLTSVSSLASLI